MGSRGDAYDNAVAETFFATLKKELVNRRTLAVAARAAVRRVRVHRGVLQPPTPPLHPRDALPSRLRTTTTLAARRLRSIAETTTINRQTRCHANRGRSTVRHAVAPSGRFRSPATRRSSARPRERSPRKRASRPPAAEVGARVARRRVLSVDSERPATDPEPGKASADAPVRGKRSRPRPSQPRRAIVSCRPALAGRQARS